MKLINPVIQRFVADQKLPIQIYEEPYFSYFIELYNEDFGTKEKYQMLLDTLAKFESQQAFLDYFYKTRDAIIQALKETKAYEKFIEAKNPDFVDTKTSKAKFEAIVSSCGVNFSKKSDVYSPANVGKYFLSIDLRKANFQVLKKYDKELVFGASTYEEMISKFTDLEYIKSSKYIREVIFGCINTGRQVTMQRFYTGKLIEWLVERGLAETADFAVYTNDEIVLKKTNYLSSAECEKLQFLIKEEMDLDVSVESFKLAMIGEKEYFVKELNTGEKKFKAIPAAYYAQIYKKYKGLPINDYDLMFYFERHLAKFIKPLF